MGAKKIETRTEKPSFARKDREDYFLTRRRGRIGRERENSPEARRGGEASITWRRGKGARDHGTGRIGGEIGGGGGIEPKRVWFYSLENCELRQAPL